MRVVFFTSALFAAVLTRTVFFLYDFHQQYQHNVQAISSEAWLHQQCSNPLFQQHLTELSSKCEEVFQRQRVGALLYTWNQFQLEHLHAWSVPSPGVSLLLVAWCLLMAGFFSVWTHSNRLRLPYLN